MTVAVIFNHGKESGPKGTKINALSAVCDSLGVSWSSVDYRGIDDPEARADKLRSHIKNHSSPVLLVGSSMGSYVSLRACKDGSVVGLFLLAPAVYMPGYSSTDIAPVQKQTLVIHGWNDEIVPVQNAITFATNYHCELLLLKDDHGLSHSVARLAEEFKRFLLQTGAISST